MKTIKSVFTNPVYTGLFWLVLRVYVGYEFVSAGIEKWQSGKWLGGDGSMIAGFLKGGLAKATGAHPEVQGWYADLTHNVFLPNAALFQNLVAIGEVCVGLALIFGLMTKFAAVCGALMNLAFLGAGTSSSNPTMLAVQVAAIFAGAGVAFYGVDYFLMPFLAKKLHIQTAKTAATETAETPIPAIQPVR